MAGETVRSEAICLEVYPWSRTSHIVSWLTPYGKVATVVKGAVRSKSAFLGQYDLNYTCEILYYARARGELHALRDCAPLLLREGLRRDYRALAVAGYFRFLVSRFAPQGPECAPWCTLLGAALDDLERRSESGTLVGKLVDFELKALTELGLKPDFGQDEGGFFLRGERRIPVSSEVAKWLRDPQTIVADSRTPLDAARVIGVFYYLNLDLSPQVRRSVLGLISKTQQES